ncbi:MAG: dUTP diphosphatase [Treponemataceae bacterium]
MNLDAEKKVELKIIVSEGAKLPEYKTFGAAGADVCAFIDSDIVIKSFERKAIPTGLYFEIPDGYEIQIRPRSGLAIKNGISLLNTPATIDSDYRGELHIILVNFSQEDFVVHKGDRIAQMVLAPVVKADFKIVNTIGQTERDCKGFGSTGI